MIGLYSNRRLWDNYGILIPKVMLYEYKNQDKNYEIV